MNKAKRYSPEVRERAVRLLFEHEKGYRSRWAAKYCSVSSGFGRYLRSLRHRFADARAFFILCSRRIRAFRSRCSSSSLRYRTTRLRSVFEGFSRVRGFSARNSQSTARDRAVLSGAISRFTVTGVIPLFRRFIRHFSMAHSEISASGLSSKSLKLTFRRFISESPRLRFCLYQGPYSSSRNVRSV